MDKKKSESAAELLVSLMPVFQEKVMRASAVRRGGEISPSQYQVLTTIFDNGPLSMSALAARLQVSKPNLTPLVDKLLKSRYVVRNTDGRDRRVVLVSLAAKGRQFLQARRRALVSGLNSRLRSLGQTERTRFASALSLVRNTLSNLN
jgi:MarR family transcriptional regulator, organic hydroperoxide resistance regulator